MRNVVTNTTYSIVLEATVPTNVQSMEVCPSFKGPLAIINIQLIVHTFLRARARTRASS